MAPLFTTLPALFLAALLQTAASRTSYNPHCVYRPLQTGLKIRLGDLQKVSAPWTVPNPYGFRCLAWPGPKTGKMRLDDSVCYNFEMAQTGRYAVKLSPPWDARPTDHRIRAVVRIFSMPVSLREPPRFVDWIDYEGKRVMTKRQLLKGRRYKVCVTGRVDRFVACGIEMGHCGGQSLAQCSGGSTSISEWGRFMSQCSY